MSQPTAVLLSLRPRFATAILDGSKTVEVRRRPTRAPAGTLLLLYASSPTMAIVGTAELEAVEVHDPDVAWKEHESSLGLSRDEFDQYLEGSGIACLIHIREPRTFAAPIPLSRLRAATDRFNPPQSLRYITNQDPLLLLNAVSNAARSRVASS
ncbi:ASCH domain-containing protein [Jiangella muralis]|uniref:ASCH domain-containing protein n=1 Tax=Jiangella muralis TaxID=702383 RepID=UPI0009F96394